MSEPTAREAFTWTLPRLLLNGGLPARFAALVPGRPSTTDGPRPSEFLVWCGVAVEDDVLVVTM